MTIKTKRKCLKTKEKYEKSDIRKEFQTLNISQINEDCAKCNIKFLCGGRCRGETFQVTNDVKAKYPYCSEWKKAMEKIYWILVEYPELGENKFSQINKNTSEYLNLWH